MNPKESYIRPVTYCLEISGAGFSNPDSEATTEASVSGLFTIFQLATGLELFRRVAPALKYVEAIGAITFEAASRFAVILQIPPSPPPIRSTATCPARLFTMGARIRRE